MSSLPIPTVAVPLVPSTSPVIVTVRPAISAVNLPFESMESAAVAEGVVRHILDGEVKRPDPQ